VPITGPHNYGYAVSGPVDEDGSTKPVLLRILRTESLRQGQWVSNPWDDQSTPAAGNDYETPYIGGPPGACNRGQCVSNAQPAAMAMTLEATVSDLSSGTDYNLYEYDLPSLTGAATGTAAALPVPTGSFNHNAGMASQVTRFTAAGPTFSTTLSVLSDRIVVFRAVPADAP